MQSAATRRDKLRSALEAWDPSLLRHSPARLQRAAQSDADDPAGPRAADDPGTPESSMRSRRGEKLETEDLSSTLDEMVSCPWRRLVSRGSCMFQT